jgi:hypothetical protein
VLAQVRWKRLVVDEGHFAGAHLTDIMLFAQALSAERRWLVTGTPTTNLLGLSFGAQDASLNPVEASQDALLDITLDQGQCIKFLKL